MSVSGKILFSMVERVVASGSPHSRGLPQFLARHRTIHRLAGSALRSRPCRALVADLCHAAASKYGGVDPWDALQALSAYRRFSEGSPINVITEICERTDRDVAQRRLRNMFGNLTPEQKVILLTRVFYNLILIGLDRKVATIRGAGAANAIPNLSTILLSVCSTCNINCAGCESADERDAPDATAEQLEYVIAQVRRLNIFHVFIVGKGEPFLDDSRKRLVLQMAQRHWDLNFVVITNGTTLEERDVVWMRQLQNVFALVSLDGLEEINDRRRGEGVFARVVKSLELMRRHRLVYGFSATVFRQNFRHVLSDGFLAAMSALGCRFGLYLSYIPLSSVAVADMALDEREREEYEELYARANRGAPIPLLDPELFERAHGCRAKRGALVYIDAATGKVAPCVKTPFAPESSNIYRDRSDDRLREILQSDFFAKYRSLYGTCGQCSVDLQRELARYVVGSTVSASDRERADRFRRKAHVAVPPDQDRVKTP